MAKAAKTKIASSAVVVLEAEVVRKIRQHARTSMKAEVCGVLLGRAEQERTLVEACIAGLNAAQGGAHVTFTQDTWEHIYKTKDRDFPDHKIVGWYHSHPGFGVFLSEHDTFIHRNFFSSPGQVAWVFDPQSDEEGCFGWVNGRIERLTRMAVRDRQAGEVAKNSTKPQSSNGREEVADTWMERTGEPANRGLRVTSLESESGAAEGSISLEQ